MGDRTGDRTCIDDFVFRLHHSFGVLRNESLLHQRETMFSTTQTQHYPARKPTGYENPLPTHSECRTAAMHCPFAPRRLGQSLRSPRTDWPAGCSWREIHLSALFCEATSKWTTLGEGRIPSDLTYFQTKHFTQWFAKPKNCPYVALQLVELSRHMWDDTSRRHYCASTIIESCSSAHSRAAEEQLDLLKQRCDPSLAMLDCRVGDDYLFSLCSSHMDCGIWTRHSTWLR